MTVIAVGESMVPKLIGSTVGQRGELPQIAALTIVSRLLLDFRPHPAQIAAGSVTVMSGDSQEVSILSASDCWNLLSGSVALGRLVTSVDGARIFPSVPWFQNRSVLFRTAQGHKAGQRCHQQQRVIRRPMDTMPRRDGA